MTTNEDKLVSFLQKHDWYQQRFNAVPFFLALIAAAELKGEERKMKEGQHTWRVCFFEDGKADWYILKDDLDRTSDELLDDAKNGRNFSTIKDYVSNLRAFWREDEKRFYAYCECLDGIDFEGISKMKLLSLFTNLRNFYVNALTFSSLVDSFSLSTDERFSDLLKRYVERKGLAENFAEYFSILSTPMELSFVMEAEKSLMEIALKAQQDRELLDLLDEDEALSLMRDKFPSFYQDLQNHQKKCFWIKNNYRNATELSLEFFFEEFKTYVSDLNLAKKLDKYLQLESIQIKKSKILEEIDANDELRALTFMSGDFAIWQDDRKKMTFYATHYFTLILEQIARETGYTLEELKFLVPVEIELLLQGDKLGNLDPKTRVKNCVFAWNGDEVDVFTDPEFSETLLDAIRSGEKDDEALSGLTACPGKVVGQVRILDTVDKLDTFNDGEVLVAVMTRPDYVAAMKKAAAIVTDEGGVTSHAAVISRELNIPCVVGTKVATRNLKDGDFVEVDGGTGIIKKLPN